MCAETKTRTVERPSVPAIAWVALGMAGGAAVAERAVWLTAGGAAGGSPGGPISGWGPGWLVLALIAGGAAAWGARVRWPCATLVVCGLLGGAVIGGVFWVHLGGVSRALSQSRQGSWSMRVLSDPMVGAFGSSSTVELTLPGGSTAQARAEWPKGTNPPAIGQQVDAFGSVITSQSPEAAEAAWAEGIAATLRVRRVREVTWERGVLGGLGRLRAWESARIDAVAGRGGALLGSTLLGQRWRVAGGSVDRDMRVAGLAHFEATSGYHVMLLAGLLEWALVAARVGRRSRGILVVAVIGAFVLLTGGRVSAIRGWGMGAAAGAAHATGRRGNGLSALALTAGLFLALAPPAIFDLGFQMSVLGIGGILVFARLLEAWLSAALPRVARPVAAPVGLTLCAVVATLPLTASAFGVVSLVAPLANLLAVPLVVASFVIGAIALGVGGVWGVVGALLLQVAAACSAMLADLAAWLAALPHAAIPVSAPSWVALCAGCIAAALMWAWWPQPRTGIARACFVLALTGVVPLAFGSPVPTGATITVMDVGQGDSILVRDAGQALLVDTGPDAAHVLPALARMGVRSLTGVVITHLHADHFGGLSAVASVVHVPVVFLPAGSLRSNASVLDEAERDSSGHVEELVDGDRLRVGAIELDVVSPAGPVQNAATNEASVVMVARDASETALLTGDAESGVLEAVGQRGELPAVDVLKVGHHGSAISLSPDVLAMLHPGAAVISVGAGNRYGHPTPTALRMLGERAIPTYRTDTDGDVTIAFGRGGVRITTSRRAASKEPTTLRVALAGELLGIARGYARLRDDNACGLARPRPYDSTERDDCLACRSEDHLPHLRVRGPPSRPSARAPAQAGGGGGRHGLQLGFVRG